MWFKADKILKWNLSIKLIRNKLHNFFLKFTNPNIKIYKPKLWLTVLLSDLFHRQNFTLNLSLFSRLFLTNRFSHQFVILSRFWRVVHILQLVVLSPRMCLNIPLMCCEGKKTNPLSNYRIFHRHIFKQKKRKMCAFANFLFLF